MRPAAMVVVGWLMLQPARTTLAQSPQDSPRQSPAKSANRAEPVEEVYAQPVADRVVLQGGILDNRVDKLLEEWAKKTSQIRSLYVTFVKSTEDRTWGTKNRAEGSARYLHPNRARLDVGGEDAESYVLTGPEIWHYRVALKQIVIYELPPEMQRKEGLQDGPLPFLFAAEPNHAKARYRFQILKEEAKELQLSIVPKYAKDQEDFINAEVWLDRERLLPNKLFFVERNGSRVTYDFTGIWQNIEIKESDFEGQLVKDWQVTRKKLKDDDPRRNPTRPASNPADKQ